MSKARKFTTCLLLAMSVFGVAWSTSAAAPDDQVAAADQVALAVTLGPQENVSRTSEMSEAPQAAVFNNVSVRAIWGERYTNEADNRIAVSEKTVGGPWSAIQTFREGTDVQYQWPDIAVTPDGTTHIIYAAGNRIFHRSRPNGGGAWSDRREIATSNFPNPVRAAAGPDGSVWAIWRDANGSAISFTRSTNGGLNWSPASDIAQGNGVNLSMPDIAVGPDGAAHAVWFRRGAANGNTIQTADWTGSGWTLGNIGNRGSYAEDPSIVVDSNNVQHIVYRRQASDSLIEYVSRAPGQGWTASTLAAQTSGNAGYAPSLAVDPSGGVHITYSSLVGSGRDIFYTVKLPGRGFDTPVNVSENSGGWNTRSAVVATANTSGIVAHVFYQRGERGQDIDEIYYRTVTSPSPCGTPGTQPTVPSTQTFKVYLPLVFRTC